MCDTDWQVRDAIAHIRERYPDSTVSMIGMSAGTGPVIRYLGEESREVPISAAVIISPGYEYRPCLERFHWAYAWYMLWRLKCFFLKPNESLLKNTGPSHLYHNCMKSSSMAEFHDNILQLGGYNSVDEYYSKTCPLKVADSVCVPTLILNALDDPVCHRDNIEYDIVQRNHHGLLVTVDRGSHCAFLEGFNATPWMDRAATEFLKAVFTEISLADSGNELQQ